MQTHTDYIEYGDTDLKGHKNWSRDQWETFQFNISWCLRFISPHLVQFVYV